MTFRYPESDLSVAEQFQSYARSGGTLLVWGAIIAVLIGLATAGLQVWDQYDRFSSFDSGMSFRTYALNFLQTLSGYGLIAAVLFAAGMLVNSLAWFYAALGEDMDDLYEGAEPGSDDDPPPATDPSAWGRHDGA